MVKVLNREAIQRMNGRGAGSVGSGGSSEGGGGISLAQVDAAYVSKAFFDQLFTVHGKRTYTDPETQEEVTEDVIISPNQIAEGEYSLSNVEVSVGLWTNSFLSALGLGTGGGGGGATALSELVDVALSNPTNGQVLMYNSSTGKWYNGTVQSGGSGTVTSITAGTGLSGGTITSSGTIALSQETQTAIANGVTAYGWGDHAQAGYLKQSDISDMATKTWVGQQGYITSSALTEYATQQWVQQQGYLTSHQSVDGTFWGQSWTNHGTVKGSIEAGSNGGSISGFHFIELNNHGTLSGYGGYIDFHYNGSAADYTTRLIESEPGVMLIQAKNSASPYGDKAVGLKVGSNVTGESYVQIGNVQLVFDATNNALKVINANGTAANFYATGGVSALGMNSGGGGGGASALTDLVDVALSNPQNGQVLMYNSSTGKWYNGTVQSGGGGTVTSITAGTGLTGGTITSSGTIALSQETQTAIANGVTAYGWGDHAQAGYLTSSALNGYATQQWVQQQGYLTSSALTGYATQQWVQQQGYLTSSALNGYATQQWVQQQGYLTSHQSVDGTFWGQSWNNHGSVSGNIAAGSNGGTIEQFDCIELNNAGSLSGFGGYIDFHYNGSAADYTTRLIESEPGVMLIQAKNSASPYGDKAVGLKVGSNVTGESYVQIGNVQLVFDATNNALKVINANGTAANFYATGGVSALGMSAGVSQVDAMTFNYVTINNNLEFGAASRITHAVTNDDRTLYIGNSDNSGWVALQDVCSQRGESYWKIMANGEALFAEKVQSPKFYLDSTRYIYVNGGTLYYFNGSTSRQIAFA